MQIVQYLGIAIFRNKTVAKLAKRALNAQRAFLGVSLQLLFFSTVPTNPPHLLLICKKCEAHIAKVCTSSN
ncbi:hypothetical protein POVWA1_011370 [Plasmodium ovale wallikeri]|uniref:Uncharacterized protein n=1 Tax=Plasmodium ovale wallikeri TaxID=864142 RepID=A0A1A8YL77_PLAOA|nr:hypothetical protein POVWA1_011370 [Plasmodium ovale wallikeri]